MPVYTVHAPEGRGGRLDPAASDSFVFVRDGFHFWAAVLGAIWLAWQRLWLALLGWIILLAALELLLTRLGAGPGLIFLANLILSVLLGLEAAGLKRWTLARQGYRQLDVVVADDEEAAERRFFERWTRNRAGIASDGPAVDRGAPPPREEGGVVGPLPGSGIVGLFPEPGGPR